MTTGAPNCDRFSDRLMEYLEQDMDVATRASIEEHASVCVECGALLADIRRLRVDAAHLPELTPSRDLWAGIAARIETPVVPIGGGAAATKASSASRRNLRRWLNPALVAASLLGAATLGYTARGTDSSQIVEAPVEASARVVVPPAVVVPDARAAQIVEVDSPATAPVVVAVPDRGTPTGVGANASAPVAPRAVEVQLAAAALSADYNREIARLRVLIEQRRPQLDPATITVIERNLAVIDTAIAESRRAIATDPNGRFLLEFLNQSLQAKVELMRTAALLPSRT